ncbi:unnamed protein product [Thlaspi arvense]|uniref:NAB domain-containing protein n=1 Tax=Thlaspi arvense TaxID=13288 RepID=A0AAU9S546_THLAR|nr:unnamed protein product [Thlaspi arvense]
MKESITVREEDKSRWWWFESHKTSKHSHWLHSTLAELDAKTKAMLKLIEGNADSFAQRAETYYKKRPELIAFLQDFYRAHRSLAERFDHLKSSRSACGSTSHTSSELEDADSEIEDPEVDEENAHETWTLEQERLKLIEERDALRKQLLEKDEEKRAVIRQLARTVETLKDDNSSLKRRLAHASLNKRCFWEYKFLRNKIV